MREFADRSSNAKRNLCDQVLAEAMLEAVEDFFAAVADDFAEPHAAVHGDKERAFADAGGLGMGDDAAINEIVPDLHDFGFGLAFELPVVVLALVRFGVVTFAFMRRTRPYAVVLIFILATVITDAGYFDSGGNGAANDFALRNLHLDCLVHGAPPGTGNAHLNAWRSVEPMP